jgi:hypothetical protein
MSTTTTRGTDEVRAEIEAQPALQPGESGWWKVWGARARDIRPGDYVLTADEEFYVQDTFAAKSIVRLGIVCDGERSTIGMLCPVVILRPGTHHTLSESAR